MADKAAKETDKILSDLEKRLDSLYNSTDKKLQSEIEDLLSQIYLDDEDATQRQRLKYANKNGLDEVVEIFVTYMLLVNEKAVRRINNIMSNVADINYSFWQRRFKSKTDVDIGSYDFTYTVKRYGKRAYNRLESKNYISKDILKQIKKDIKAGKSTQKIADGIQKVSNKSRTSAILTSRTETVRIMNLSRMDSFHEARKMGIKFDKMWNHSGNRRAPRHWHQDMNGVIVEYDKPFDVDGIPMMQPGDPDGGAKNVCNCGCFVTAENISF